MDKKNMTIIVICLILLCIVVYGMLWITQNETKQCITDPVNYGMAKTQYGEDYSCLCFSKAGRFNLDKNGISKEKSEEDNFLTITNRTN